ncbi:MAG: class II aldolase/adducin family protein [Anaerolineales bacterium]|nr:class II aldolase/adducin family protein [Anaerolineales bacterium]
MSKFQSQKEQIVTICRMLLERGYLKATEGNISCRLPGGAGFAITPSNYDYAQMQVEDICVLDFEMQPIEGERKPSIESGMHAAVYEQRPDAHIIIHTHQPYASALAIIDKPIPALFDEQVRLLGRGVDIIPYGPSGTSMLAGNVRKKVGNGNNAYILKNHGVLVLGGDAERAIHNMALLEKCALTYLLALLTEEKVSKVPVLVREIAFSKLKKDEKKFAELTEK